MANQEDGDHHNNDDSNDIDNTVLIRIEFLEFHKDARNENKIFFEKSQKIIGRMQKIATLLGRKLSQNNND